MTGIVTVGLLESTTDLLAEPLVSALARDQPGIDLRLMTAYSGHLQQRESLWGAAPPDEGLRADRPVPCARAAAHPLVMPASGHALRSLIDGAAGRCRTAVRTGRVALDRPGDLARRADTTRGGGRRPGADPAHRIGRTRRQMALRAPALAHPAS
ncbi:hypothetical protein [Streptomyces sp. RTd22]|uniref:hypothetical protein n=1 Tax=Streptomyces sp. RTd22 TaxID=1841249 RepID=UPI001F1842B9|nr:hypothetical protein [Streptomyces sp. RTd22]